MMMELGLGEVNLQQKSDKGNLKGKETVTITLDTPGTTHTSSTGLRTTHTSSTGTVPKQPPQKKQRITPAKPSRSKTPTSSAGSTVTTKPPTNANFLPPKFRIVNESNSKKSVSPSSSNTRALELPGTSRDANNACAADFGDNNSAVIEFNGSSPDTSPESPKASKKKWMPEEIRSLIEAYGNHIEQFKSDNIKQDDIWQMVARELGGGRSYTQCKHKFRFLKKIYNKKMDTKKNSGGAPIQFDYFHEFNEMFGEDHNVTPLVTTSSFDPSQIDESLEGFDNMEHSGESATNGGKKKPKTKKTAQAKLLDVVEAMRTEKEERFAEQMEIRKQSLTKQDKLIQIIQEGNEEHKELMKKLIDKF